MRLQPLFASLLLLPAVACTDDAGGLSEGTAGFAVTGSGSGPIADGAGTAVTLTAGHLDLRRIELDLPAGVTCADVEPLLVGATCEPAEPGDDTPEAKIRIEGPFDVDLVAGTSTPTLDGVVIPAGTYTRVDLRVEAFAASATFDGGAVELAFDVSEDIRVEQPGGVAVAAGDDLIARFATGDWLAGVDLAACHADAAACEGMDDLVKENFKESGDLVDDH